MGRVLLAASLTVLLNGCGKVAFVPAPFSPVHVELAYAPAEDLTRLRFAVADDTALRFELEGGGTFVPIAFDRAPYASGRYSCAGATCFQLVLRGAYVAPMGGVVVRAQHDDFGTFPGAPAIWLDTVTVPVTLDAAMASDNTSTMLTLDDWLAAPGLERHFQVSEWAEANAPCAPHLERPDDPLEVASGPHAIPFALATTDPGRYCVRARPVPHDAGTRAAFVGPLLTAPDVFRQELDYQPAAELSPIVWRLITDLEIVDPARCTQVATAIHQTIADALSAAAQKSGAALHEMAAVDLAPGCRQVPTRTFDAGPLADEVKRYLTATFQNQFQRSLLVYVNNLDAPLPPALVASLKIYAASFPDLRMQAMTIGLATGAGLGSFSFDLPLEFVAIEDPQFVPMIDDTAKKTLPFASQLHRADEVVPLMSPPLVQTTAGLPWKVCQASPAIERVAGTSPVAPQVVAPLVELAAPPGFLVPLPEKILIPSSQFRPDTVVVRYEVCRRWCDHPFFDEAGARLGPWSDEPMCVRSVAP